MVFPSPVVKLKAEVIRSNRRTISVAIVGRGLLKVRCAPRTSEQAIVKLIEQHWDFFVRKLSDYSEVSEISFENNSVVMFKGKKLKVVETLGLSKPMLLGEDQLLVLPRLNSKERKEAFVRLCQREARKLITRLVEKYINVTGLTYNDLRLKDTSSRWGS